jgi:hypothetical protein
MRAIIAVLMLVATGFIPVATSFRERIERPPPLAAARLAGLGRDEAMGAVYWMMTTQKIGSDRFARANFPALEDWLESVFTLNPYLRDAYVLGTVVLLVDPERAPRMQGLLARAEERFPDDFQLPMLQGISAYFGELDAAKAARHFRRASTKPLAPPFLAQFGQRLEQETADCGALLVNLRTVAAASSVGDAYRKVAGPVLERCIKRELEQAAASFKLNKGVDPTGLEALIEVGLIKAKPPAPPGKCWTVINVNAYLQDCEMVWRDAPH